jgi:hypothetical protein
VNEAGPTILAFVLASVLAALELATSKYPRTVYLLRRCCALHVYALVYGIIAAGVAFFWSSLSAAGKVQVQGLDFSNPWVRALAVGITVKAFLHIRFFTVRAGADAFPVGVETLVQLFEPWLLETIDLDHYQAIAQYIAPRAVKYNNLQNVRSAIQQNTPRSQSTSGRAFLSDVQQAPTVVEMMRFYLVFVGTKLFDAVFPP